MLSLFGILLFFQAFQSQPEHSIINVEGQNFDSYFFGSNITGVIQDQQGVLWIGTNDGVISYDGYISNSYAESLLDTSSQGFLGNYVEVLFEDSQSNIWAATNFGTWNLLLKDSTSFINVRAKYGEQEIGIRSIIEIDNATVMSNSNIGFHILRYQSETHSISHELIEYASVGIEDPINKLFTTKDGEILFLNDGLFRVSISDVFSISTSKIIDGENIWHISEMESGVYLVNDINQLYVILPDRKKKKIELSADSELYVHSILYDSNGKVWVGTADKLISFTFTDNYEIQDLKSYGFKNTKGLLEDRSGNIFFAPQHRLVKLNWNYTDYKYIDLPEKYGTNYAYKFYSDIEGNYWISHWGGILKYYVESEEFAEIQGYYRANAIKGDKYNNVWTADNESVKIYNPKTNEIIHDFENGNSFNFDFQSNGDAWLINNGLIKRIRKGSKVVEDVGIKNIVRRYYLDESEIWLHSPDFNLRKYQIADSGLVFIGEYLSDKPNYRVNWIEGDLLGNIWMSTRIGILIVNKKSGEIESIFNKENKLNGDNVYEIIRDQSGVMWVKASSFGSTAIDPETLESVSFTPSWLTQPNSRGFYCVHAVGNNGQLFTEGRGGFYVFHPDSIKKSDITPKVSLVSTKVNDEEHKINLSTLKYYNNDLEFEFTGVQFDDPNRNEFSFYLEGYDNSWNFVGSERSARYLSLPAGNYTFFVRASNSDKVWSEPVALAGFKILPPWWANPIAYFVYIFVLVLIGYKFYQIQLNKKLAESEALRLKEVDEFKSRFFTNISHEFRTPLTVILGLAERIQHQSTPVIKRNAAKLLELINQILELSRVESNQARLKPEQFDFINYVQYTVESLSTLANERGIGLSLKTEYDDLFVELDKQKVDLILHNLLSNALKFTEKEGQVIVKVKKGASQLIFSVSDTGLGIKKEALDHIFNRFFQSDSDNHRYEGTGIGLALTNELVQLMGGSILVESELGLGSTFTINLPCIFIEPQFVVNQKVEAPLKPANETSSLKDAEVVLLVEDNYDVRSFIKQVLADEYKMLIAHNGEEGIKCAIESIPDVIITDLMMPKKDGFELTEELKKDVRTNHIPIVMLTAKADVDSRISGLKTGADVYLGKPFNEEELKTHIQNLIHFRNLIRKKFEGGVNIQELGNSPEDEFVKKIHSVIIENLDDDAFGIEEICKKMAVSRTQLHRKLKALTGKSTSIFIRDIRLTEAKKMLKTTQHTISEIAYSVGFSNPNYFTKLFSEKYKHSPTKEREMVS